MYYFGFQNSNRKYRKMEIQGVHESHLNKFD